MSKTITLNHITKIEGHAKLRIVVRKGKVARCELSSVEGSRYFEGIVKGRKFYEAHEMTSRICGICSCAHVIAAISAIEDALGYKASMQTKELRILMTLAERIRSHATHLYFLALPDYLGYDSALAMAPKYRNELKQALNLMKTGNGIIKILAARDLHPVSATIGGWLKLPEQEKMAEIGVLLEKALPDAISTCRLFFSLKYPDFSTKGDFFSLMQKGEYAVLDGKFGAGKSNFDKSEYRKFISEYHEPYTSANFVVRNKKRYFVGALARLNNNFGFLRENAKKMLKECPFTLPSTNPYHNNAAQAIELVHCIEHAIDICRNLHIKKEKVVKMKLRSGKGIGCIEVPRGTLWHEYTLDSKGVITNANIITPTAQNLLNMQEDIREILPSMLNRKKEDIILEVEKLIRSYDPCFSCSAHFLEVEWL
ncbi:Ni/Fe hydrogenase subunit alpha [Candidatus Woesearchaeota archaeon]|nr:Ni/Fe hydrogenase subunit alpha [Candidatus Woesearchaeota archaeon]